MSLFNPLLTKDERRELSQEERKALKVIRRAERKLERSTEFPKFLLAIGIDRESLEILAKEAILDIAGELMPGEDKMLEVLDELAGRADRVLTWGWAPLPLALGMEAADGPLLRALVHYLLAPEVQRIYDGLEAAGLVVDGTEGVE